MTTTLYTRDFRVVFSMALMMAVLESSAQEHRFGFQIRPGVSFPTTERDDTNLKTGFGFEFTGTYRFMPHVSAYAGWGWNRFSSDRSFAGLDMDFEETGYAIGLMFLHPFPNDLPFAYFLKAGAIYNHVKVEDSTAEIVSDSGHGFGFQVETGLSFSVSDSWHLTPGIKYQTLSRDLPMERSGYRLAIYVSRV
jgi:opacity protein-like surface antigen